MYRLSFINPTDIRMGSPFNSARVSLTGDFVPDFSRHSFQDLGLVTLDGAICYLLEWKREDDGGPAFRVWKIDEKARQVGMSRIFSGGCKNMKLVSGEGVELAVWHYEKPYEVTVTEFPYEPIEQIAASSRVSLGAATLEDATEFITQAVEFFDGVAKHEGPPFFRHLTRSIFKISILPGDRVICDYDEYVEFQKAWNQNSSGNWSYSIERVFMYDDSLATVVILAHYEDNGPSGSRFKKTLRIKNTFVRLNATWYLSENQNTVISEVPA